MLLAKYRTIVSSITESVRFMKTVGADTAGQLHTVDLYTSHEALVLQYEEPLTRKLPKPANTPTTLETFGVELPKGKRPDLSNMAIIDDHIPKRIPLQNRDYKAMSKNNTLDQLKEEDFQCTCRNVA